MQEIFVKANAKINLTLHITGKESNGYHSLESVMHSVSLFDELYIQKSSSSGISFTCNEKDLCTDQNTVVKAFNLLAHKLPTGVNIYLQKNIPSGSGLGGGSADAAAVLAGLNRLFEMGYSLEQLQKLGITIGADVPFCLQGGSAYCTGIGQVQQALAPLQGPVYLIKPHASLSTARVYALYDQESCFSPYDHQKFLNLYQYKNLSHIKEYMKNDLQLPAQTACEELYGLEKDLSALDFVEHYAMTGSGSAWFLWPQNGFDEQAARTKLQKRNCKVYRCDMASSGLLF